MVNKIMQKCGRSCYVSHKGYMLKIKLFSMQIAKQMTPIEGNLETAIPLASISIRY